MIIATFPAAFGHIALIAFGVSIAIARIVAWILDWRARTASQPQRELTFLTLAQAEVAATKRGDLLEAARLADLQEGDQ